MSQNKENKKQLSIYIHWPFCLSLCPYCDFNSHVMSTVDHQKWLTAYIHEIDYFADKITGKYIKSIFFGGGTPSLMQPFVVEGIINKIAKIASIDNNTEITLEANPTSYEAQKFKEFKNSGINRVSIGVQSFNEQDLKNLGRMHSKDEAINAIKSASSIFERYSFDLIYARSGQILSNWQEELKFAMNFAGGHVSLYQLTIEKGTPFYKMFHEGKLLLPENEITAEMYQWTNDYLGSLNYNRYEISNYAVTGEESVHNLTYWNYGEYIGIGPGAHSRIHSSSDAHGSQVQNITSIMMFHNPKKWLDNLFEKYNAIQTTKILSREDVILEAFMMGTRLANGIDKGEFLKITGCNLNEIIIGEVLEQYLKLDLIIDDKKIFKLTDKGLMLHNYLVPRLLNIDI
jgi:oxygen-independent coproporphyrinogen-3 oxidase